VSIQKYNQFLRVLKTARKLSHKEAQFAYRSIKAKLGRAPTQKDINRRAIYDSTRNVKAEIAESKRAKERKLERVIEHAKNPPKRGKKRERGGGVRDGGGADRGGGAGGGAGAGWPRGGDDYDGDEPSDYDGYDPYDYDGGVTVEDPTHDYTGE
jgi:uncharacterized membrane protein YgcG